MSDAEDPTKDFTFHTGIGPARGERRAGQGRAPVNLDDVDQVFDLALRVANGTKRDAEWLGLDQIRAIALLAVNAGVVRSRLHQICFTEGGNTPENRAELVAWLTHPIERKA